MQMRLRDIGQLVQGLPARMQLTGLTLEQKAELSSWPNLWPFKLSVFLPWGAALCFLSAVLISNELKLLFVRSITSWLGERLKINSPGALPGHFLCNTLIVLPSWSNPSGCYYLTFQHQLTQKPKSTLAKVATNVHCIHFQSGAGATLGFCSVFFFGLLKSMVSEKSLS